MVDRKTALFIRKAHRYLGIFIGIQFLFWTVSGLYFSWTNIDEIHGDQFKQQPLKINFKNLLAVHNIIPQTPIYSLELKIIGREPYYWINDSIFIHAQKGTIKREIIKQDALLIAENNIDEHLQVKNIELITDVHQHHEYRNRPLPAYVITYNTKNNVKAYVSIREGNFERIRHRAWRWFDFLWMTHTMDYETRDNFNNTLLRVFSLMGLITVLSGFLLWVVTSPNIRSFFSKFKKK